MRNIHFKSSLPVKRYPPLALGNTLYITNTFIYIQKCNLIYTFLGYLSNNEQYRKHSIIPNLNLHEVKAKTKRAKEKSFFVYFFIYYESSNTAVMHKNFTITIPIILQ